MWPAESTVELDDRANSRFRASTGPRGKLCRRTSEGIHALIDVFIDDGIYSGAGGRGECKNHKVV